MYSLVTVCVCVCVYACVLLCLMDLAIKVSRKLLFMDLCKIHSGHSLHTTLEMINFWCRSHLKWLTFLHLSYNIASVLVQKVYTRNNLQLQ